MHKILFCFFLFFSCNKPDAQNIALHKNYVESDAPNYTNAAPSSDTTSLTDGKYTSGHFWTQPTTAGWLRKQVSVTIDLSSEQAIGSVTFNTARNINAEVNFPENVFVFISANNKNFSYAGDIVSSPENIAGSYSVKKFSLNNINISGRYVTLVIVPDGKFIFCDEIEVIKGIQKNKLIVSITKEEINTTTDSLIRIDFDKYNVEKIQGNSGDTVKSKASLFQQHAATLGKNFNAPFVVEKYNAWSSINELHTPQSISGQITYDFSVLKDGSRYGSFVVTNTLASAAKFSVSSTAVNTNIDLAIFAVPFVNGSSFSNVADPLIQRDTFKLQPGASQLFLFKITGKNVGLLSSTIVIQSGNLKNSLTITTKVLNLTASPNDFLNANVWAYLNAPMLKDRPVAVIQDLKLHHINTIVVPPAVIPKLQTIDYSTLITYLSGIPKSDKILLFMNYSNETIRNAGSSFMNDAWKQIFLKWYNGAEAALTKIGFQSSQIYLYPYDEVKQNDIDDFKSFATWVKKTIPSAKIYATVTIKNAAENLLPLLDVAQIPSDAVFLKNLPTHNNCEIWIYDTKSGARSLSPYTYYRLKAWRAFANDITGIGFWNYANEGKGKMLNLTTDIISNPEASFSVIYNGPDKQIISSRRWEAFSAGVEDYAILKLYAKKFGIQKAKALANNVLTNATDTNKADEVIQKILQSF